jgi:uncharacterized membrane protein YfcA
VTLALLAAIMAVSVMAGTLAGERQLFGRSRDTFRRIVGVAIGAPGLWLTWSAS